MRHKCTRWQIVAKKNQRHFNHKAETAGDVFLLKTDYMYKTDPELKAIAEVSFLLKHELKMKKNELVWL